MKICGNAIYFQYVTYINAIKKVELGPQSNYEKNYSLLVKS